MSKPEHRLAAERCGLRYPSELTDAKWALFAPLILPARRGGRRRSIDVQEAKRKSLSCMAALDRLRPTIDPANGGSIHALVAREDWH